MGQAKSRGTRGERVAAAMQTAARMKAPVIACNVCMTELPEAELLDTAGLQGVDLAFKAHCSACDQDTWAVRGEASAVNAFYDALEKSVGGTVKLGSAGPGRSR